MTKINDELQAIDWRDDKLCLLDQRHLPHKQIWQVYDDTLAVSEAITEMVVRGAPAIGITAAYAVVLAARTAWKTQNTGWKSAMAKPLERLANSRPTAVNLHWAIERMSLCINKLSDNHSPEATLLAEAKRLHHEDIAANHIMGRLGAGLLTEKSTVLTHCNAGALATGGVGTALGVIRQAYSEGKIKQVFVDETRPWLQGARLTAWELHQEDIPVTLQVESAAASLMAKGALDWVIVGADRISANGDVANKIGTYMLAVLAKYHGVKMMVVAPSSTIDWQLMSGDVIPIEQRKADEITTYQGHQISPVGVTVSNPAFDITPANLIDAIVTEKGVILSPSIETMCAIKD